MDSPQPHLRWFDTLTIAMPYETVTYRRVQLYEEVWAEAVHVVAKRYKVSGVALAKTCRKLRIPLPERGYWARKRAGQKLKRPPLPPLKQGEPDEITVSRWQQPERPKPTLSPETEAMIAKEAAPEAAITVPAALEQPHKLIAMSAKALQRAKPFNGAVHVHDRRCLDIHVSPAALDRVLRIMDALVKALEARELRIEVTEVRTQEPRRSHHYDRRESEVPSNATRVKVLGEWIRFSLTEKIAHKRSPPPPAPKHMRGHEADFWQRANRPPVEYEPTGNLTLLLLDLAHLSVRTSWRDGKRQRLEACLNDFVTSLFVAAEAIKANRIEQERLRRQREEEAKRRWEEQRRREEEAKRVKELENVIGKWRLARDIRAYVAEARGMVADAQLTMSGSPYDRWLNFASNYAEDVDPLAGLRDDIARALAENEEASTEVDETTSKPEGSPSQ